MEIQFLISKKGTKVVTASHLHLALGFPNTQFPSNAKRWLSDIYEFKEGGIRRPESLKDYAKRPGKEGIIDDYYLSVELAKLITLSSKSKVKFKYATWLHHHEDRSGSESELLSTDQVLAVLELSKVMGLVSCQAACEHKHLETYEARNNGSAANWWNFRAGLLGYSTEKLKEAMAQVGKKNEGKSQRQMLMQLDKYEMVRTGVVDLFMALGKTDRFAKNMGNLAKVFAEELKVEIFDDRDTAPAFTAHLNTELADEVKSLKKGRYLQLWESQRMAS